MPGERRTMMTSLTKSRPSTASSTVLLERQDIAAPPGTIGGDDEPSLRIDDAVAYRFGGEAGEDDVVNRPDAGAGQHGDDELRYHGKVDRHAVAFFDADRFQGVGELADVAGQVPVGQDTLVAGLALPDERGFVAPFGGEMDIEAVGADIGLAALEPLEEGGVVGI